jgi:hypothetical protein
MTSTPPWETFLASCFPGYLLPEAYRSALPEPIAARFLERLGGGPRRLFLLRATSVVAAHADAICRFALDALPALAAALPARARSPSAASSTASSAAASTSRARCACASPVAPPSSPRARQFIAIARRTRSPRPSPCASAICCASSSPPA